MRIGALSIFHRRLLAPNVPKEMDRHQQLVNLRHPTCYKTNEVDANATSYSRRHVH